MAKGARNTNEKNTNEITCLSIRTVQGVKSFCRAGHRFSEQPTLIALELLTKEQIAALKGERKLIVEDGIVDLSETAADEA